MRTSILMNAAVLLLCGLLSFQKKPETLSIGDQLPLPAHKMMDISGKEICLNDIKKDNGLLVIFSCNSCPFVIGSEGSEGWEGRYDAIREYADSKNVGMILLNSNEAKRQNGDDLASMKLRAMDHGFGKCYYALDEKSMIANAFFARTTPHVFLFDKNSKLVYKGSIDNNVDDHDKVTEHFLNDALQNLAAGKSIDPAETKPVGCSIKRAS